MKQRQITISLPKPCSENWDAMSLTDKDRFCASCQKTVTDFRFLNDSEIIDILKKEKTRPLCGYFLPTQLNRALRAKHENNNVLPLNGILKKAAVLVFFLQYLAPAAFAQRTRKHSNMEQHTPDKKNKISSSQRKIMGRVIEFDSHKSTVSTEILIRGTNIRCVTDSANRFTLYLPDTFTDTVFTIESKDGISSRQVTDADISSHREIYLCHATMHGTLGAYSNGLPGDSYKRSFWQRITKPFRKKPRSNENR